MVGGVGLLVAGRWEFEGLRKIFLYIAVRILRKPILALIPKTGLPHVGGCVFMLLRAACLKT